MAEFVAITTQEQLDSVIGDRLKRNEEKWAKKYEGYISQEDMASKTTEFEKQIADLNSALEAAQKKTESFDAEIASREATIKSYELQATRQRIAREKGLSWDAIPFLNGDDEEAISASADALKTLVGTTHLSPSFANEPQVDGVDDRKKALKQVLKGLNI